MDNIAGSPVEGDDFFGRQAEVARQMEILANDDILLLGPRRIGKTSLARAIMAALRCEGWLTIEINVASCIDERGFLDKLDAALTPGMASITTKGKNVLSEACTALGKRVKSVRIPVPGAGPLSIDLNDGADEDWTKVACDLLQLVSRAEKRWLIYVDELPILLFNIIRKDPQTGVQRVRRFLDWFRNDVRALPSARQVRWLVSGSVGLDTLVQQHGMADTINSMRHTSLEPFKNEVAIAMLSTLADRYQMALTANDVQAIVDAVQWTQPYYLQATFNHLRDLIAAQANASPASLIEQAVDKLTQPGCDNDFHHWEQRLSLQLPLSDARHAGALLNLAARDPFGARAESLLAELQGRLPNASSDEARHAFINLRDILQRDAYWWADESSGAKRYRFCLEPLRRWWLRRNTL